MYNAGADPNYMSSPLSSGVAVTVTSNATFSISSPNNSIATAVMIAAPGGSGSSTLTITSVNSFAGTVTLGCGVGPLGANDEPACSFVGGNTVTLTANGTQTKTLMLSTTAASLVPSARPEYGPQPPRLFLITLARMTWIFALTFALAGMFFFGLKRHHLGYLWLAAFLLVAITQWSCAGGHTGSISNNNAGTTTGVYTVTVTGTSGAKTGSPASVFFSLQ